MTGPQLLLLIAHLIASYYVGRLGGKRKIGFPNAFLLSFLLSPFLGVLFVLDSKKPEEEGAWKKDEIPDGYSQEVRIQYSRLLTDFHEGEISEEEFERRKGELLNQNLLN
jgi:hypothetical protein